MTEILGKDSFSFNPLLEEMKITGETKDDQGWVTYKISCKVGMDKPLREIVKLLEDGMELKFTNKDGIRKQILLVDVL